VEAHADDDRVDRRAPDPTSLRPTQLAAALALRTVALPFVKAIVYGPLVVCPPYWLLSVEESLYGVRADWPVHVSVGVIADEKAARPVAYAERSVEPENTGIAVPFATLLLMSVEVMSPRSRTAGSVSHPFE
jgi:hypothetical protein